MVRTSYDLGDEVFHPSGLPGRVELVADVHHPTELTAGPFPLVVFLHGNHSSCFKGRRAGYSWPCRRGWEPIPNHEGYAYIARRLASHGFVVASISGNGVNVLGNYVEDTGMRQRGELIEEHIGLWDDWSTAGGSPFGTRFVGAIDLSRVGAMGHSRGGEGAVWSVLVDREQPSPYGIDAVLPLAPVDFTRVTINEVPLGVILPSCDGDVSDLQGVHFYDDSRYVVPGDPSPRSVVTAYGANHNFFNTVWSPSSGVPGSFDDGACRRQQSLTENEQRRVGIAYVVSFFQAFVGGNASRGRFWTGAATPRLIRDTKTAVSYLAPDLPATRLDVARFDAPSSLASTHPGGAVTTSHLSLLGWCENTYDTPCVPGGLSWSDIHLSFSWFGVDAPGLQRGTIGWSTGSAGLGVMRFELPGGADVSALDDLVFRTVLNPGYAANDGTRFQDLVVALEDASGATDTVRASSVDGDALRDPFSEALPGHHIIAQQIRFALSNFPAVDLADVVAVELRFSRTPRGVIDVSDLAFQAG